MTPNANHNARLRSKHLIIGKSDATRGSNYADVKFDEQMRHKVALMNKISNISLFEKIWYAFFVLAGVLCLIFIKPFDFELVFAVISLYLYMISNNMTANGNKVGMIVIIVSSLLYSINCFFYKIYGEIIINVLVYIPIYIFSFVSFNKNTNKENSKAEFLEVKKMSFWLLLACVFGLLLLSAGLYFILNLIQSAYPLVNAISIVAFLIGMIVRIFRYIEFWWFDLIGNIFSVLLWVLASTADASSIPFVLSTISSVLNGIYGFIIWRKLYRKSRASKGVILAMREIKISKIIKVRRRYKTLLFKENLNSNEN